jgi:hypothetical protein
VLAPSKKLIEHFIQSRVKLSFYGKIKKKHGASE